MMAPAQLEAGKRKASREPLAWAECFEASCTCGHPGSSHAKPDTWNACTECKCERFTDKAGARALPPIPKRKPGKALVPLARFQAEVLADAVKRILMVASRRVGKTFGLTLKIANALRRGIYGGVYLDEHAFHRDSKELWKGAAAAVVRGKPDWFIVSRTQDAAKENLAEVATHLKAMKTVEAACSQMDQEETELSIDGMRVSKFSIHLNNGCRCFAMTAHPDALRGFGAHDGRLYVSSTPHYQTGNFFELCRKANLIHGRPPDAKQQGIWSTYWVDVYTAFPQLAETGLVLDIPDLMELAGDTETWLQEFLCRFLSGAEMWFSPQTIEEARSPSATVQWNPEEEARWPGVGRLYVGVDVGRYRDLTVIFIIRRALDLNIVRGVIVLERTNIVDQVDMLKSVLRHPHVSRLCIDNTGMGVALADAIRKDDALRYKLGGVAPTEDDPERREGQVSFTLESKERMMVLLRDRMERHLEKIPENFPMLERALESIKATPSALGHKRFDSARTDPAKHADAAWAMALAAVAADSPGVPVAMAGSDPQGESWRENTRSSIWVPAGDRDVDEQVEEEAEMAGRAIRGGMGVFQR